MFGRCDTYGRRDTTPDLENLFRLARSHKSEQKIALHSAVARFAVGHASCLMDIDATKVAPELGGQAVPDKAQLTFHSHAGHTDHRKWPAPSKLSSQGSKVGNLGVEMARKNVHTHALAQFEGCS